MVISEYKPNIEVELLPHDCDIDFIPQWRDKVSTSSQILNRTKATKIDGEGYPDYQNLLISL